MKKVLITILIAALFLTGCSMTKEQLKTHVTKEIHTLCPKLDSLVNSGAADSILIEKILDFYKTKSK